jgi:hypothetical protein
MYRIGAFAHFKFPPSSVTDCKVTSGPEKQWCVCEEGYKHRGPNPNILTSILICFIVVADPTPKLLQQPIGVKRTTVKHGMEELTPTGVS